MIMIERSEYCICFNSTLNRKSEPVGFQYSKNKSAQSKICSRNGNR